MNAFLIAMVLCGQVKPATAASVAQVRINAETANRKLDRLIAAEKARATAQARAKDAKTQKSLSETKKRVQLLELKLERVARARPKVVTVVRYVPARPMKVAARKPGVVARPSEKESPGWNWMFGMLTAPRHRGRLVTLSNWD